MVGLASLVAYKLYFWSGYLWVVLPTIPLAVLETSRKNIQENMQASVQSIALEANGTHIVVTDLSGRQVRHPIETLRKANDDEIVRIFKAGGPAFVERMKDFYPVCIQTQYAEVDGSNLVDILMIDNKGQVGDKPLF